MFNRVWIIHRWCCDASGVTRTFSSWERRLDESCDDELASLGNPVSCKCQCVCAGMNIHIHKYTRVYIHLHRHYAYYILDVPVVLSDVPMFFTTGH